MVSVIHAAYISQRLRGKFSGEIHGHLAGKGDRTFPGAGAQIVNADPKLAADEITDRFTGNLDGTADQSIGNLEI